MSRTSHAVEMMRIATVSVAILTLASAAYARNAQYKLIVRDVDTNGELVETAFPGTMSKAQCVDAARVFDWHADVTATAPVGRSEPSVVDVYCRRTHR